MSFVAEPGDRAVLGGGRRAPARGPAVHELRHVPLPAGAVLLRVPAPGGRVGRARRRRRALLVHRDPARGDPGRRRRAAASSSAVVELPGTDGCRLVGNVVDCDPTSSRSACRSRSTGTTCATAPRSRSSAWPDTPRVRTSGDPPLPSKRVSGLGEPGHSGGREGHAGVDRHGRRAGKRTQPHTRPLRGQVAGKASRAASKSSEQGNEGTRAGATPGGKEAEARQGRPRQGSAARQGSTSKARAGTRERKPGGQPGRALSQASS